MPRAAHSATFYSDITVELGIEIGNQAKDYADAGLAVEKDRFVEYRITVTNNGDIPHSDITVQMDNPDYMAYVPGTTYMNTGLGYDEYISDTGDMSGFNNGYVLDSIDPGQSVSFYAQYQAQVPEGVLDDPLYTLAWASIWDIYSGIPKLSQTVETAISSTAKPVVQGTVEVLGGYEGYIMPGMQITYSYKLHNVGGIATSPITFTTYLPENMKSVSGFGTVTLDSLGPNEEVVYQAVGEVKYDLPVGTSISGINPNTEGNFATVKFNEPEELVVDDGSHYPGYGGYGSGSLPNDFSVIINQVPNIVLNSRDGINPRNLTNSSDNVDRSETQYVYYYPGLGKTYTYPSIQSDTTDYFPGEYGHQCDRHYPYTRGSSQTYAYNSKDTIPPPDCESGCSLVIDSTPVVLNITTTIPEYSPEFVFTENSKDTTYLKGVVGERATQVTTYTIPQDVNKDANTFMKDGTVKWNGTDYIHDYIPIDEDITEIRAIRNGSLGIVHTEVNAIVTEELWKYELYYYEPCTAYYDCDDDDGCSEKSVPIPHYHWVSSSSNIYLPSIAGTKATDDTSISVYTSTAWLKTQGGHIGTNSEFTNNADNFSGLNINQVDLAFYETEGGEYAWPNEYLEPGHKTSSQDYTPPEVFGDDNSPMAFNAEYMIFGNVSVGNMTTSCGKGIQDGVPPDCSTWLVTGTEFPFLEKGDAYDREINPRNYDDQTDPENNPSDLLGREKFGEVRTDVPLSPLTGIVDLGDNIIWNYGDANITIGSDVDDDMVTFSGGQSRIYTTGTVYIKADIKYKTPKSSSYNDITSVRIDAANIYIDGEVEDIEAMLLAREQFHSGVSKKQLRILGDVIAGKTFWEREPLLEYDVEDINRPSEYIIEDMRKYIVPAPGDTELPDDYTIWRQVNPATGEMLDGY